MSAPTKLQRWLDLIAYLVGRRFPVAYEDLIRGVPSYAREYRPGDERANESLRRKFERDKNELRELGIPIRTVRYTIDFGRTELDGYQLDSRDFYLPYLDLLRAADSTGRARGRPGCDSVEIAAEDAPLALEALRRVAEVPGFPLRREARSAFRKLAFDLDPDAFRTGSPVLFIEKPGTAELAARLRTLSEALLARKRVRFSYHGIYRDQLTERDVAPYGLLFQQGNWYLVGHDRLRAAIRVFRVGRIAGAISIHRRNASSPDYQIPADFSLAQYADRSAWELGNAEDEPPLAARVRFSFPLSLWAARNDHGTLVAQQPDGAQVREFSLQQVDPFLRWLLSLEGEAEILEPEQLRQEFGALAAEVARVHAEAEPGRPA